MGAKKYFIDYNMLMDIKEPVSAYILGFLWADGTITKVNYGIQTTIKSSDFPNIYEIFNKIGNWGQYHRKKYVKKTNKFYDSSTIFYNGKHLHGYLKSIDYRIKSYSQPLKVLSLIPDNLIHHFIRGYVDGDGSFCFYTNSNGTTKTCKFNITSGVEQEWNFIENVFNRIGISKYKVHRYKRESGNSSIIGINNKWDIIKIGDYLYKDSKGIRLERKYNKYLEIKNSDIQRCHPKWTEVEEKFIIDNYREKCLEYCMEKLGKSKKSIFKRVHLLLENPNKWSKDDEEFLLNNYREKGLEYCMNKLNRTDNSIKSKYKKLIKNSEFLPPFHLQYSI